MKKIIIALIVVGFVLSSQAQQMISFSQTVENKYLINPAVAGSDKNMPLFLGYKRAWTGINNSPSNQILSYHMNLGNDYGGVGGRIFNYSTGSLSKAGINVSYAYHIKLKKDLKLSFGLDAALYQFNLNMDKIKNLDDYADPTIINNSDNLIVPDANFGIFMYAKKYYAGISTFQIFGRRVALMNDLLDNRQVRHYFLHGGYIFKLNSDFKLEPSLLVKYVESNFGQWDINVKTSYQDFVWLSLGYRSDFTFAPNDVIISVGLQQDKLKFGYAFDYTLSDIGTYSKGTHEIILMYHFGKSNKRAYKW